MGSSLGDLTFAICFTCHLVILHGHLVVA